MNKNGIIKRPNPNLHACIPVFIKGASAKLAAANAAKATGGVIVPVNENQKVAKWACIGSTPNLISAGTMVIAVTIYEVEGVTPMPITKQIIINKKVSTNKFGTSEIRPASFIGRPLKLAQNIITPILPTIPPMERVVTMDCSKLSINLLKKLNLNFTINITSTIKVAIRAVYLGQNPRASIKTRTLIGTR